MTKPEVRRDAKSTDHYCLEFGSEAGTVHVIVADAESGVRVKRWRREGRGADGWNHDDPAPVPDDRIRRRTRRRRERKLSRREGV